MGGYGVRTWGSGRDAGMVQICIFCEPAIKWKYLDLYSPVLRLCPLWYACGIFIFVCLMLEIEFKLLFHEITF